MQNLSLPPPALPKIGKLLAITSMVKIIFQTSMIIIAYASFILSRYAYKS